MGKVAGAQGGLFAEIFDVRVRYSGISIAYQVGGMIGGAVTPLVAIALQRAADHQRPAEHGGRARTMTHTGAVYEQKRDALAALVEVCADGLAVLDAELCFAHLNTAAVRLLGEEAGRSSR
jgi:PAS domain-containing protein